MNRSECIALVTLATASCLSAQDKDPEPIVNAWELMLQDIPFPIAKAALLKVCRSSRFFPTVADIVAAAREINPQVEQLPTAEEAWAEVQKEILRAGHNLPTRFSTPTIRHAVEAIGWMNILLSENAMADRAHFLRIYDAMRTRQVARSENETVLKIAGVGDMVKMLAEKMEKKRDSGEVRRRA